MAEELLGKFRCVVLTPRAKLLDCKTRSITLPAHDGQIGVLQNHMPMLCKLGMGIMEVREFVTDDDRMPGARSCEDDEATGHSLPLGIGHAERRSGDWEVLRPPTG